MATQSIKTNITSKIQTINGDTFELANIKENEQFKGYFDALIGSMCIQFSKKSSGTGYHEVVFMGVSHTYLLAKFI